MTYIQIFTGGEPIDQTAIDSSGARQLFAADVDDWAEPPEAPRVQSELKAADLPGPIRALLAKAMCKAIKQATGFKVTIT
ncbi:hypothetical protein [Mycolicibacterium sp. A43C]